MLKWPIFLLSALIGYAFGYTQEDVIHVFPTDVPRFREEIREVLEYHGKTDINIGTIYVHTVQENEGLNVRGFYADRGDLTEIKFYLPLHKEFPQDTVLHVWEKVDLGSKI